MADAVVGGYLKNHETNKGKPARIWLGEPLPEERVVLPEAEKLRVCTRTAFSTDADAKNGHDANSLDNACRRAGVSGRYVSPLANGSAASDQLAERAAIFEYEAGYSRAEAERFAGLQPDDGLEP